MACLSKAIARLASSSAERLAPGDLSAARSAEAVTERKQAAVYKLSESVRLSFSHISAVWRQPAASFAFWKIRRRALYALKRTLESTFFPAARRRHSSIIGDASWLRLAATRLS